MGGGIGGLVAANELRRRLPRRNKVVLVEKNSAHAFAPSFLWLMTGTRGPQQIITPLGRLVRKGVEVIHAEAVAMDILHRRIVTEKQTLDYDYLIVALGAELAPELIPGLAGAACSFYTFEDALKLRDALDHFKGGNISIVVSSTPYKCPAAPHEAAMLIADFFQRRGLRGRVDIHLYTPESQPMPVAGPQLGEMVKQMLLSKGIGFHPLHKLASVDSPSHELVFEGKERAVYDLLIAIPPHRGLRVAREAGLTNDAGWIPVERSTLKTKFENVYAIGDIAAIGIPGRWKPEVPLTLPKAGIFAHIQAEVVAHRIADEINGNPPKDEFSGRGYCMLEAGEGLAGFASGDFFAEPSPQVSLHKIGKVWHLGKVLFEQWWLAPRGIRKELLRLGLNLGAKAMRIPIKVS